MFNVTLVAFLVFSASFSSSIVDNSLSDHSAKRPMLTIRKKDIFLLISQIRYSNQMSHSLSIPNVFVPAIFPADHELHMRYGTRHA